MPTRINSTCRPARCIAANFESEPVQVASTEPEQFAPAETKSGIRRAGLLDQCDPSWPTHSGEAARKSLQRAGTMIPHGG